MTNLLILFGAGVEPSDCARACSSPGATGRWIIGLSLVIFVLPLAASRRRLTPPRAAPWWLRNGKESDAA